MNSRVVVLAFIIAIVVAIGIATTLWVPEGPITLDDDEYRLGENIFMRVRGLDANEKGNILAYTPKDVVLFTRPYDGSAESDFNFYFAPDVIKHKKICSVDDLVGTWKIVFEDGSYPATHFKITDEYLPGAEEHYDTVC